MTPPWPKTLLMAPDAFSCPASAGRAQVAIVKVFDGDGFLADYRHSQSTRMMRNVPFRFAFIDAPEISQPFGPEARELLSHLILGRDLELELICKESTAGVPLDPYRRVLCMGYLRELIQPGPIAYFWQGHVGSGTAKRVREVLRNIELEMIVNGYAWVVRQWTFEHEEEYFAAEDDARSNMRGLWAGRRPEPPWVFKARVKRWRAKHHSQSALL